MTIVSWVVEGVALYILDIYHTTPTISEMTLIDAFLSSEVTSSYNAKIKIRKNGSIVLRQYRDSIEYIEDGYEEYDNTLIKGNPFENSKNVQHDLFLEFNDEEKEKEIRYDSLSRTRDLIVDYASQNADKFNSFLTLTFKDEIFDISVANKKFDSWKTQIQRYCKKHNQDFYYLGVPEFQKNGRVHYHVLTSLKHDIDIIKKEPIKTYNNKKGKWYDIEYYDIPYWSYGYSSSFDIKKETDDNFNLALYLIKYLYKDMDNRLFGNKKILKSNNLEKPDVFKLKKDSIVYKTAINYINEMLLDKKIEIKNIYQSDNKDIPYLKDYIETEYNLCDNDNILKDILQDLEEF